MSQEREQQVQAIVQRLWQAFELDDDGFMMLEALSQVQLQLIREFGQATAVKQAMSQQDTHDSV